MPVPDVEAEAQGPVLEAIVESASQCRSPGAFDRVYKDECMYTFATPEHADGLFTNLKTWEGVCSDLLLLDSLKSGCPLYLWERHVRMPLTEEEKAERSSKPTEMAIGTEEGFRSQSQPFTVQKEFALAVVARGQAHLVSASASSVPAGVAAALSSVMEKESASKLDDIAVWREDVQVSRYAADLEQLPAKGKAVSMDPATWKCYETGDTGNLWLNLSTGVIGSGRPQWDGEKNIGGNGSALRHFEATGRKYPLAVKLGTITPDGADVYSYAPDEDDMVLDPLLKKHLLHWGIDMARMEKTEKTMAEWQVDFNMQFEFNKITEAGSSLRPVSGPGFLGLKNLGSTCYMNSVLQVLHSVPDVKARFADQREAVFQGTPAGQCGDSLGLNLAKLGRALCDGVTYAPAPVRGDASLTPEDEGRVVNPARVRRILGKGHAEFSSNRQQDAAEFLSWMLDLVSRAERADPALTQGGAHPGRPLEELFQLGVQQRVLCTESGKVAYKNDRDSCLALQIDLGSATNMEAVSAYEDRQSKRQRTAGGPPSGTASKDEEDKVLPRVPLAACLGAWTADETIEGYHSAALGRPTTASKSQRVSAFPPFLFLRLDRYCMDRETWTAKKIECEVEVPETLDLEHLRGAGPQPDEELQPEDAAQGGTGSSGGTAAAASWDDDIVAQIVAMGFSENGAKRACLATGNGGGGGVEACMNWVLEHMGDPDINDPPVAPGGGGGAAAEEADPNAVAMLCGMGFSESHAKAALKAKGGSTEQAADWLLSNMDDLDSAVAQVNAAAVAPAVGDAREPLDGPGKYELVGFISHMGQNTSCGHYVCHIKKDVPGIGKHWVIFNDEKVALSENPPFGLGYVYLFKRVGA